ncbi:peptide-methionine (S)-S-oxide reductase [Flavobacterium sp. DG1-102-2]|uniref:peptide-methionine (S)-S-oxide reductase n=1 Tax=Flavobacterium sp. DG1-102-2 TaxID=3081663 RepID=UPI002949A84F|nr:peptide-methionine (S)-S-oxide reductase [Flavobacterium sp. DG1-102-2]MDV6170346.1 peptide-methionine (S)-S-oxide reductase [Flavobacterium sp. DG1-102-2]
MVKKAGFGGGCHWCTEAVFMALKGVQSVQQGWIASDEGNNSFSEEVIVEYDPEVIGFDTLIAVHLYTHGSTSQHSMRGKYRSAVYTFQDEDSTEAKSAIARLQLEFEHPIITQVLSFADFKMSRYELLNYYFSDTQKPFCENYINPKLKLLMKKFASVTRVDKLRHL